MRILRLGNLTRVRLTVVQVGLAAAGIRLSMPGDGMGSRLIRWNLMSGKVPNRYYSNLMDCVNISASRLRARSVWKSKDQGLSVCSSGRCAYL
jgi:hypothetical protein